MVRRRTIEVNGMACDGCESNVEEALAGVDGVHRVEADHEANTVEVAAEDEIDEEEIGAAIQNAGYEVVG